MSRIFFISLFSLCNLMLFGQSTFKQEPFILKGQLKDCPEKFLILYFEDNNYLPLSDTIYINEDGTFYFKSFKIKKPQRASIQKNRTQINDIFIAPGYDLTLTGNAKDYITLSKTKKLLGVGSVSNQYQFILDSILIERGSQVSVFQLKQVELISFLQERRKLQDSIIGRVFSNTTKEKYLSYVKQLVELDNQYQELNRLLQFVNTHKLSYDESISFVKNNLDKNVLRDILNEKNLTSSLYKDGIINNEYLDYLVNLDYLKDSSLKKKSYKLEKVKNTYEGKVREYVLYKLISTYLKFSRTFSNLNTNRELVEPYIPLLTNINYKKSIDILFAQKDKELSTTLIGKPALDFTLEDNFGKKISLHDFKGKVVYLDVWASWCGPCRAETPSFKLLHEKYKNDSRVIFISIAARDTFKDWKNALGEDKPEWIQLIDKDDLIWKSYTAYTIPNFILINKNGNILKFDAPMPSSGIEIEKLIDSAITKE
ncbi:MAG: TlpA family protein disulfide reductase [Flavobacterium sp.]|nr:TlpA family protein disulfide reductase [Flavobacterium sp.]